ncbi:MAG: SpoIIE family protein phosphatase [Desulfobacterium sp.]|nr:SpoIIE family protein phosphatase [Desulfobacterium sp.]
MEARKSLIQQATGTLQRLVEGHAGKLKCEGDLVVMALQVQAAEIERRLNSPGTDSFGSVFDRIIEPPEGINMPSSVYCKREGRGRCKPIQVSHDRQTFCLPPAMDSGEAGRIKERLSSMTGVYRALKQHSRGVFLWQIIALENGVQTVYPGVNEAMPYDARQTEWYRFAKTGGEAVWGDPGPDPLTGSMAFPVYFPVHGPDGWFAGVTAIMVPVNVVLHGNEQIRMLSNRVASFIVKPEKRSGSGPGIRIIADEGYQGDHRYGWNFSPGPRWLSFKDSGRLEQMGVDLTAGRSGVREISYDGEESLMAYCPISSNGTSLLLVVPRADLILEATGREKYVQERFREEIKITTFVFSGVILGMIVLATLLSRYVTRNIKQLADASELLTAGDFSARVDIRTRDELGIFGQRFNRMVPALEESLRMKQGLDVARNVQQSLLPRTPPEIKGLDVAATSIYCDETGGDFYDFIRLHRHGTESLGIAVGDVSGHGVSAALLMATARAFLRCRVGQLGNLSEMMTEVNRLLCQDTEVTCQFMTLFYVEIIPAAKQLRWIRAGHDPAFLYDPAADSFVELMGKGMPLGVDGDFLYHENSLTQLDLGQVLVIGTDGIWEARNPDGEMFGKDRLKELIRQYAGSSAEEMVSAITLSVRQFQKTVAQEDDITLVVAFLPIS